MTPDEAWTFSLLSLREPGQFALHILDKAWLLFEATPAAPLYIADNPIGLQNSVEQATPLQGNLGLSGTGTEISLPIDTPPR